MLESIAVKVKSGDSQWRSRATYGIHYIIRPTPPCVPGYLNGSFPSFVIMHTQARRSGYNESRKTHIQSSFKSFGNWLHPVWSWHAQAAFAWAFHAHTGWLMREASCQNFWKSSGYAFSYFRCILISLPGHEVSVHHIIPPLLGAKVDPDLPCTGLHGEMKMPLQIWKSVAGASQFYWLTINKKWIKKINEHYSKVNGLV